ncbi:MAG TPA: hypothetical protein VFU63_07030, partial [Ktedonobacterales bacterium]|nr:hypothetical protein [Ktedonobacterales bacterium]
GVLRPPEPEGRSINAPPIRWGIDAAGKRSHHNTMAGCRKMCATTSTQKPSAVEGHCAVF